MKFRLHVVYADDDAISTLSRPRRWWSAFLSESLTPEREVRGSVPTSALLCPLLKDTFTEEGEIGMGIGILAGSLLTADRMLQFGRLCPTYERAKDDGRLIFHLH